MKLEKTHPARRAYELGFKKSVEKTRSSIIISLLTTIGDYVDDEVAKFTESSDFDLGEIGIRKIALYVIIPVMDSTWEGLINLFFNQTFQELYAVGAKNNTKLPQPVIFYLDEFPNLGRFDDYEKFLATCRGYGIACCTVLQNISQLQDKYGKEQAESILGNCGVKLCLGNVNDTTAEYFSRLAGKSTIKVDTGGSSESHGEKGSSSSSTSFSYTARNLINADEILTMKPEESICIITGKYPMKLKKTKQFELFPNITKDYRISQKDYKTVVPEKKQEKFKEVKKIEENTKEIKELKPDLAVEIKEIEEIKETFETEEIEEPDVLFETDELEETEEIDNSDDAVKGFFSQNNNSNED